MTEKPETIGELHDRLPKGDWVNLPECGVRVMAWPTSEQVMDEPPCADYGDEVQT